MKMKLFSRVTAVVLTLAMLIPCMMIAPASAAETDPAVTNIYHYKATGGGDSSRNKFKNTLFPNNVVDMHNESWRIFRQYSVTHYGVDGPQPIATQAMQLGNSPSWQYSSNTKYSGRPVEVLNNNPKAARILDNIRFELGGVEYPVVTKGMEALNISFDYLYSDRSLGLHDQLKVFVSLDGETWLPDSVGIRSEKFLGVALSGSTAFYRFKLETDNLLEIEGVKPGDRIVNIMVQPMDPDSTVAGELQFITLDLNAYATKADFDRLVPADVREYVHVGEDTMRQIVVDEGKRAANIAWTTDSVVHTRTGNNHIQHMPGIEYRGSAYGRTIDATRELLESAVVNGKWMGGNNQDNFYTFDCQTFVFNAACRVSRTQAFACMFTFGTSGISILGEDFLDLPDVVSFSNYDVIRRNDAQTMFKSYALAKPGDHEVTYTTEYDGESTSGSHVRLVTKNHTVYNDDGTIDGDKSYVMHTQQSMFADYHVLLADGTETIYSATGSTGWTKFQDWLAERPGAKVLYGHSSKPGDDPLCDRSSYNALYNGNYVLCTSEFYKTGDIELQKVQTVFAPKTEGKSIQDGGVFISATSNYRIVASGAKLEDLSTGEVLFDNYSIRIGSNSVWGAYIDDAALNNKLASLSNGSYRLSFVCNSGPLTAIGQSQGPINTNSYDFIINDRAPKAEVTLSTPESADSGQTVTVDVKVSAATDAADVEVKFDTAALTFQNATSTDNIIVNRNNGIISIMAVDAGIPAAGTLSTLTFKANEDMLDMSDYIFVKSAAISSAAAANTADATKATDSLFVDPAINFNDVSRNAWYHTAVSYVAENNVMSGFGGGRFGPDEKLNRAMVVQVLYNYEGQPAEATANKFPDIKNGDWYFNATRWGANRGVVSGYGDGRFGPNDNVTVEQVAVILHNYSGKPAAAGDLSSVGKYDDWAAGALQWAVSTGVLKGVPFTNATETATRAQTAQMLTNFLSK